MMYRSKHYFTALAIVLLGAGLQSCIVSFRVSPGKKIKPSKETLNMQDTLYLVELPAIYQQRALTRQDSVIITIPADKWLRYKSLKDTASHYQYAAQEIRRQVQSRFKNTVLIDGASLLHRSVFQKTFNDINAWKPIAFPAPFSALTSQYPGRNILVVQVFLESFSIFSSSPLGNPHSDNISYFVKAYHFLLRDNEIISFRLTNRKNNDIKADRFDRKGIRKTITSCLSHFKKL